MNSCALIAGVDEAGRGPLAGPVYAAAVILDPKHPIAGLTDSKKLTERKREQLYEHIKTHALAWGIAKATPAEIDDINILQASLLAMSRAIDQLNPQPTQVLVDGTHCPKIDIPARAVIKGDLTEPAISAASILAKVERDRWMLELDKQFPEYQFAKHKGYGTKLHMEALKHYGPCPSHRRSFAPVRKCLNTRQKPEEII